MGVCERGCGNVRCTGWKDKYGHEAPRGLTRPPSLPSRQAIKFLQQAVGLRGYAAKDPLTEFKLEGYNLFVEMTSQVRRNVIYNVYQFQPQRCAAEGGGALWCGGGRRGGGSAAI